MEGTQIYTGKLWFKLKPNEKDILEKDWPCSSLAFLKMDMRIDGMHIDANDIDSFGEYSIV